MDRKIRIGGKLHRIDLLIRFHLRDKEKGLIPPSQMRMLEFIEKNEGCTQAELAEEMGVSPASVAQSLKRMEASGFISRGARKENLRANSLRVTDGGVAAARRCRGIFDELENIMYTGFDEDEKAALNEMLSRLIDNLESGDTGSLNNMELTKMLCSAEDKKV